jgi:hypothetical protein
MTYDGRGRKIAMDDPDMGVWTYEYNALGELIKQTDAKGQVVEMAYDVLGRMIERSEAEGVTRWTYDTQTMGIGKLAGVSGPDGYSKTLSYVQSFALSVTRIGWEYTRSKTNRLKIEAHQVDPEGQRLIYNEHGEIDTIGVSGVCPGTQGVTSWLGETFGMSREGSSHWYDIVPGAKRFVNWVSKPHDFMNSWRYTEQGFNNPFQSQVAAELFELYSFTGMPLAAGYTASAHLAGFPIDAMNEMSKQRKW